MRQSSRRNQTYTGGFSPKAVWIDRAYAKYTPKDGVLKGLSATGGKMPIPFVHTDMPWDPNVTPEGTWAVCNKSIGPVEAFAGGSIFLTSPVVGRGAGDRFIARAELIWKF